MDALHLYNDVKDAGQAILGQLGMAPSWLVDKQNRERETEREKRKGGAQPAPERERAF